MSYSSLVQLGTANSKQRQRTQNIADMDFPTSALMSCVSYKFGLADKTQKTYFHLLTYRRANVNTTDVYGKTAWMAAVAASNEAWSRH